MVVRILALALVALLTACAAEPDPPDVAYRKLTMNAVRSHLGSVGMLIRGQVERAGDLERHTQALAGLGVTAGGLFPEGSLGGSSEAKPEIWRQREEFQEALGKLRDATAALAEVAAAGDSDALRAAFDDVRGACRNCHEQFRE